MSHFNHTSAQGLWFYSRLLTTRFVNTSPLHSGTCLQWLSSATAASPSSSGRGFKALPNLAPPYSSTVFHSDRQARHCQIHTLCSLSSGLPPCWPVCVSAFLILLIPLGPALISPLPWRLCNHPSSFSFELPVPYALASNCPTKGPFSFPGWATLLVRQTLSYTSECSS